MDLISPLRQTATEAQRDLAAVNFLNTVNFDAAIKKVGLSPFKGFAIRQKSGGALNLKAESAALTNFWFKLNKLMVCARELVSG